jgi:hypothetical protein
VVDVAGDPGRTTASCAKTNPAVTNVSPTIMDVRTNAFLTLLSLGFLRTRLCRVESKRASRQPPEPEGGEECD